MRKPILAEAQFEVGPQSVRGARIEPRTERQDDRIRRPNRSKAERRVIAPMSPRSDRSNPPSAELIGVVEGDRYQGAQAGVKWLALPVVSWRMPVPSAAMT